MFCKLVDKYILSVNPKAKNSPQWMSKSLKNIINLRQKAWAKYKRTLHPSDSSKFNYVLHRNECTAAVRRAKYECESNLVKGIKVNPKRFWKYIVANPKLIMLWVDC